MWWFLRAVLAAVALPWVVAWGALRATVSLIRLPGRLRAMGAPALVCPAGHANPVMGRWTCGCGATYLGHAFGPCPICGMPAGWVECEHCGLAIRSPWKEV